MRISICKASHKVSFAIKSSSTDHFYFSHIPLCSSSLASTDQTPNQHSFTVNYLINSFGFPLEKAMKASERVNFETAEKPDSVITFLCNHGFTDTQASSLVRKYPCVLVSNPEKTLLPKLDFFKSKGVSSTDVVKILLKRPCISTTSLKNQIIPAFGFLENLIGSEERMLAAINNFAELFAVGLKSRMAPNVEILREARVTDAGFAYLLTHVPRAFQMSSVRFRWTVEKVKEMGFDPEKVTFVLAVNVLGTLGKNTWEKKIEVYKRWGLSYDEILLTFGKYPLFMKVSEDKVMRVMDFFVNTMGLDSSIVSKRPQLLSLSFEKRIVPRCLFYEALYAKGLIKKTDSGIMTMLQYSEKEFAKKFGATEAVQGNLALANGVVN